MSVSQSRLLSAGPQSSLTHERRAGRYGRVCEPLVLSGSTEWSDRNARARRRRRRRLPAGRTVRSAVPTRAAQRASASRIARSSSRARCSLRCAPKPRARRSSLRRSATGSRTRARCTHCTRGWALRRLRCVGQRNPRGACNGRQATDGMQQTTGYGRQATDGMQQTTGYRRQAPDDRLQTTCNGRHAL